MPLQAALSPHQHSDGNGQNLSFVKGVKSKWLMKAQMLELMSR
jgi:hypothetical protein